MLESRSELEIEVLNDLRKEIIAGCSPPMTTSVLPVNTRSSISTASRLVSEGVSLATSGSPTQSAEKFRAAMQIKPDWLEPRLHLARLFVQFNDSINAIAAYRALLARLPHVSVARRELCWLLAKAGLFLEMLPHIDELDRAGAPTTRELDQVVLGLMHVCDWASLKDQQKHLYSRFEFDAPCVVNVMGTLAAADDPKLHSQMARCITSAVRGVTADLPRAARIEVKDRRRIRIGYIGAHFNNHVTAMLLAGLVEQHDHEQFEIFAYDYGPQDGSSVRKRLISAFDYYTSIATLNAAESAAVVAYDSIDVLIDTTGYTAGMRPEILALRPAPIQVNFLGHVSTQANDWIDYVIADRFVIPAEAQRFWTESIAYMPGTYFPGDRTRPVLRCNDTGIRAANGLPRHGFVFACFNNSHKITPEIFDTWMTILRAHSESVLWLIENNEWAAPNLRREASKRGVSPARLVFSKPASYTNRPRH